MLSLIFKYKVLVNKFIVPTLEPTRLCPYILEPTRLCSHDYAQTRLCPNTIVPTHVCAHSRLCPHMFVSRYICALTCYNRVVTIVSGQKHVRLCPDTFLPRHIFGTLTGCSFYNKITKYSRRNTAGDC